MSGQCCRLGVTLLGWAHSLRLARYNRHPQDRPRGGWHNAGAYLEGDKGLKGWICWAGMVQVFSVLCLLYYGIFFVCLISFRKWIVNWTRFSETKSVQQSKFSFFMHEISAVVFTFLKFFITHTHSVTNTVMYCTFLCPHLIEAKSDGVETKTKSELLLLHVYNTGTKNN